MLEAPASSIESPAPPTEEVRSSTEEFRYSNIPNRLGLWQVLCRQEEPSVVATPAQEAIWHFLN
jgi:hypothetical protein